jgi:hypothetical protein
MGIKLKILYKKLIRGFGGVLYTYLIFTSEIATDSCAKNQSTLCRKSWVFLNTEFRKFQKYINTLLYSMR